MATKLSEQTRDRLYELAGLAKARRWNDAAGWIMANMAREERKSRPKRKRKASVAGPDGKRRPGGAFYIDPKILREGAKSDD